MLNKLINWLSCECVESFADDLLTVMQTFMYQSLLVTLDIPKYDNELVIGGHECCSPDVLPSLRPLFCLRMEH